MRDDRNMSGEDSSKLLDPVLPEVAASIVVPLHNHEAFIGELLESLFAQWRPEFELLLIDDHSTDGGFAKVQQVLASHPRVRATVMRTETAERMKLIPRILELARGRIIIRADSDDVALPGRLDAIVKCFREDDDCRLVTTNALMITVESRPCGIYDTRSASAILRDPVKAAAMVFDRRWLGATIAYRREIYESFPPFDAELCPYGLDLLLPFRAVLLGTHHYLAEPLVGWRLHRSNTHRSEGHFDPSDAGQERYQGLLMMVIAQKLRDAKFILRQRPSPILAEAVEQARVQFDAKFDQWCRLRSRVLSQGEAPGRTAPELAPAAAPIPTLALGDTLRFQAGEYGAKILPYFAGFNAPEAWGAWTERVAYLSLRIVAASARAIRLEFRLLVSGLAPRQRVAIRVDGEDWTRAEVPAGHEWTMTLPSFAVSEVRIAQIVIVAEDAAVPAQVDPNLTDVRLIGVGLLSVKAVAMPETNAGRNDGGEVATSRFSEAGAPR